MIIEAVKCLENSNIELQYQLLNMYSLMYKNFLGTIINQQHV